MSITAFQSQCFIVNQVRTTCGNIVIKILFMAIIICDLDIASVELRHADDVLPVNDQNHVFKSTVMMV